MGSNINFIRRSSQDEAPKRQERAKLFLPDGSVHLYDSSVYSGGDSGERIKTYTTKPEQVGANRGWVYAANDRIADFFASSIVWKIKRVKADGEEEVIHNHEALNLLKLPNDAMTGSQLLYLHQSYLNLNGDSYIIPLGRNAKDSRLPAALHILPAHTVEYKINKDTGDELIRFGEDSKLENTEDEVTFYRDYVPDPQRPYQGLSRVAAAASAIDTDSKAKLYNQNFFANAAKPSLVIETDKALSDTAYNRFKMQLNDLHTGIANAHKPLLLENGAKSKQLALSQRDMDFLAGRRFNMDEILAMFGMSPTMLGMVVSANRANMEAAEYNFAKYVMLGRAKAFCAFFNKYVLAGFTDGTELTFEEFVPRDEARDTNRRQSSVNRYQTINEVRRELGLADIDGGDQLYRDANLVPIDQPTPPAEGKKITPKPTDDGEQEDDDNNPPPDPGDDSGSRSRGSPPGKAPRSQSRASLGEQRINTAAPLLDAFEMNYAQAMRRTFERQRQTVIEILNDALGSRAEKPDLVQLIADGLSAAVWDPELVDQLGPTYINLMAASLVDSYRMLPVNERPVTDTEIRTWARDRAERTAGEINDETRKQTVLTIKDGLAAGESPEELRARVEAIYGVSSSVRIERRTHYESGRVASEADVMAWDKSGVVEEKEWFTAHDPKVCAHCQDMDGKRVPVSASFFDKGDTLTVDVETKAGKTVSQKRKFDYEDVIGPPLDPGCRCVLLPVMKEGYSF